MRIQARITLPVAARRSIDPLQCNWNPGRAPGNPAHITIPYHDEALERRLLSARLRHAAEKVAPFRLALGSAARYRAGAG